MTNFKRKRSRTVARSRVKRMSSWPRWWNIVFHTRPKRRRDSVKVRKLLRGSDPDAIVFDDAWHKPHNYYW